MLPPSDSLSHQNHKLAELLDGIRKQTCLLASPPPPPPYVPSATDEKLLLGDIDDDDVEDDGDVTVAPIAIKIDTSISIDGQENIIAIPAPMNSASNSSMDEKQCPPRETTTTGNIPIQQLQQQRQTKSAQLASMIIAALKASGVLDDRNARQRPIEIDVNAGINVKGNANTVCPTTRRRTTPMQLSPTPPINHISKRKRRASSEPPSLPISKKPCSVLEYTCSKNE